MKRLAALLFPLFFTFAAPASDEVPCPDLLANYLTPEQVKALEAAHRGAGNYIVRAVRGTVNGRERTVVFLGEFHSRSNEEKALGDTVVAAFPCIGHECANMRAFWGGKALLRFFDGIEKVRNFALGKTDAAHGSTIMDIPRKSAIWLERNHKATVGENLALWALPAGILASMVSTAGLFVHFSSRQLRESNGTNWTPILLTVGASIVVGIASLKAAKPVERWLRDSWIMLPVKIWSDYAVVHGRNRSMAGETVQAFKDDDELDTMLVIAGDGHVPGLITLLVQQGFRELAFD